MNEVICSANKVSGEPCTAIVVKGREHCVGHLPESTEGRAKGGENSSALARLQKYIPQDLSELKTDMFKALDDVYNGNISPQQGAAMATLANAIIRVYETADLNAELQEAKELIQERLGVRNG
jgi:hypothetical protein